MSRVSRAYPPSEAYEERPRRRGGRDYQEVDVDVRESDYRRAPPDYLREDYARSQHAGPMVVRERSEVNYDGYERERSRQPHRSRGGGEEIDVDIRETDYSRAPPRSSRRGGGQDREDIEVEYRDRSRAPRDYDRETTYRREDGDRGPPPPRTSEREEITIKRGEEEAPRSSYRREQSRTRVDVDIREQETKAPPYPHSRSRAPPEEENEEIDIKINRQEPGRSRARNTGDTLAVRETSQTRRRSMPPPRNVAREREDFVYRRRSPSRPRQTEEIVIRQRKSPSPSPSPSPPAAPSPPPPPPQVETRPPIIQEVITHHRHIDHGMVHAPPSPESSPSPPPPQRRKQDLEVDIRRTDSRGNTTEEDIRIRDSENGRRNNQQERDSGRERHVSRRRSMDSGPIVRRSNKEETNTNINVNIDADFGNNSNNNDRQLTVPNRQKPREMWTEVTKDLVSRDAIQSIGYQYEETEDFFYVMAYLRYEDVAQLVDVTDEMRYGRRERIEQIQWERQDPRINRDSRPSRRGLPPAERYEGWDEVTHDREITYEDRSRRGHR